MAIKVRTRRKFTSELVPPRSTSSRQAHRDQAESARELRFDSMQPRLAGVPVDSMRQMGFDEIRRLIDLERRNDRRFTPPPEQQADEIGDRIAKELATSTTPTSGPLPREIRERAEQHLGVDLSRVELGTSADSEAKALFHGAFAVTEGSKIHFAQGQLSTHSEHGRRLLGHELVHAAQVRAQTDDGAFAPAHGSGDAALQQGTAPVMAAPAGPVQAQSFPKVHEDVLKELIGAQRDDKALARVKTLFSSLSRDEAAGLLKRLTSGSRRDDLAVYFNDDRRVPPEMRAELLAILRRMSGLEPVGASPPSPEITGNDARHELSRTPSPEPSAQSGARENRTSPTIMGAFGPISDLSLQEARAHEDWVDNGILSAGSRNGMLELLYADGTLLELPLSTIFDTPLSEGLTFVRRHSPSGKLIPFAISHQKLPEVPKGAEAVSVLEAVVPPRFDPSLTPEVSRHAANEFALFAGMAIARGAQDLAERALFFRLTARSMESARTALAGRASAVAEAEGTKSTAAKTHQRALKAAASTGALAAGVNVATQLVTLDDYRNFNWGSVAVDFVAGALLSAYTGEIVRHFGLKATTLRGLLNTENARILIRQQGFIAPAVVLANSLRADAIGAKKELALAASAVDVALGALQSAVVQTLLRGTVGDLIFKGKDVPVNQRFDTPQAVLLKKTLAFLRASISRLILTMSGEDGSGQKPK